MLRPRREGRRTWRPPSTGGRTTRGCRRRGPGRSTGCPRAGPPVGATGAGPTPAPAFSLRSVASPVENGCSNDRHATSRSMPRALVHHRDDDALVHDPRTDLDGPIVGRVAAGVLQELVDDAVDPRLVGQREQVPGDPGQHQDRRVEVAHVGDRPVDQRREVGVRDVQLERALFELGDLDDLVHQAGELVEGGLELLDELGAVLVAHVRVAEHVGDALGDGHGRPELVRDVRQELALRVRALFHLGLDVSDLRFQLLDPGERGSELAAEQGRRAARQHDRAFGGRQDRARGVVDAVFLQQVPGRSRGEHERHPAGVAQDASSRRWPRAGLHPGVVGPDGCPSAPPARARWRRRRAAARRPSRSPGRIRS